MQPDQTPRVTGQNSGSQSGVVFCAQCGAPMPGEMRFCRSCGQRLGEGPAEYTETVRFTNATPLPRPTMPGPTMSRETTRFAPGFSAPMAPQTGSACSVRRARLSGMGWVWIVVAIVFASGGGLSALIKGARTGRQIAIIRADNRSYVGVSGFTSTNGGVTFGDVEPPGSPADLAGLVGGDIVTSFDGHQVNDEGTITSLLRQTPPGKTVEVDYIRDGEVRTTQLTTVSSAQFGQLNRAYGSRPEGRGKLGFDTSDAVRVPVPGTKLYGVRLGSGIDSSGPAILAGILPNDIIVEFDGVPIRTVDELVARVHRAIPYSTVKVIVMRGSDRVEIPVKLGKS